jgi:hypothetical protein
MHAKGYLTILLRNNDIFLTTSFAKLRKIPIAMSFFPSIISKSLVLLASVGIVSCQMGEDHPVTPNNSFDDLFYGTYVDATVAWSPPYFGALSYVCCKESTWLLLNKNGSFEMRIDALVKASQRGTETDTVYSNLLKGTFQLKSLKYSAGDLMKYGYWAGSVLFTVTGIQTWEAGFRVVDRAGENSIVLVYDLKLPDSSTLHVLGWWRIRFQNCI